MWNFNKHPNTYHKTVCTPKNLFHCTYLGVAVLWVESISKISLSSGDDCDSPTSIKLSVQEFPQTSCSMDGMINTLTILLQCTHLSVAALWVGYLFKTPVPTKDGRGFPTSTTLPIQEYPQPSGSVGGMVNTSTILLHWTTRRLPRSGTLGFSQVHPPTNNCQYLRIPIPFWWGSSTTPTRSV